jgi:hypothetical protein
VMIISSRRLHLSAWGLIFPIAWMAIANNLEATEGGFCFAANHFNDCSCRHVDSFYFRSV